MGDFFGDVADFFGGIGSAIGGAASDLWGGLSSIFGADSDSGDFGIPEIGDWSSVDIPGFGGSGPDLFPQAGGEDVFIRGDDSMSNGMTPVAFPAVGGALAAGGIWLGSLLGRALGAGAAGAVYTAANGVRVKMAQLWPLVRRYGSQAVAGGLGISAGALATLLMQPEALSGRSGKRGRGRGISARDVKTTRRTMKTIRKLYHMMPTRAVRYGGGGYYRRGRR